METTPRSESEHAKHVTVDAWPLDCIEGECEHATDEHGCITDADCPPQQFTVCVDCMDEIGAGRTEEEWSDREVGLLPWPHPGSAGWTETPPAIFKEATHE
jgi:hypothetical protein